MPYLHWEIKSRQIRMAEVITEISNAKRKTTGPTNLSKGNEQKKKQDEKLDWNRLQYLSRFEKNHGHLPKSRSKHLGNYLLSIARVSEAMDYEADERLLRDYLNEKPPLHVRRTLDQSYFWTLQDTVSRDRDQVVYRGTRGGRRPQGRIIMVDQ